MPHQHEHEHVYNRLQQRLDANLTGAPVVIGFFEFTLMMRTIQTTEDL